MWIINSYKSNTSGSWNLSWFSSVVVVVKKTLGKYIGRGYNTPGIGYQKATLRRDGIYTKKRRRKKHDYFEQGI